MWPRDPRLPRRQGNHRLRQEASARKRRCPDGQRSLFILMSEVMTKKKMNGKYQVGSGRVVTITRDKPFIERIIP